MRFSGRASKSGETLSQNRGSKGAKLDEKKKSVT